MSRDTVSVAKQMIQASSKLRVNKINIIKKRYVEGTPIKLDHTIFKQFITKLSKQQETRYIPKLQKKTVALKATHKSFIETDRHAIPHSKIALFGCRMASNKENKDCLNPENDER